MGSGRNRWFPEGVEEVEATLCLTALCEAVPCKPIPQRHLFCFLNVFMLKPEIRML